MTLKQIKRVLSKNGSVVDVYTSGNNRFCMGMTRNMTYPSQTIYSSILQREMYMIHIPMWMNLELSNLYIPMLDKNYSYGEPIAVVIKPETHMSWIVSSNVKLTNI